MRPPRIPLEPILRPVFLTVAHGAARSHKKRDDGFVPRSPQRAARGRTVPRGWYAGPRGIPIDNPPLSRLERHHVEARGLERESPSVRGTLD